MASADPVHDHPIAFSLREQIAERIRTDVLSGRIPEGERLHEVKLGERYGVSRTPIREALQQLLHEGLLEGRPNAGLKVAAQPSAEVCELIVRVRHLVEEFAIRAVIDHLTESDFARWNGILDGMRIACVARDFPVIAEHDIAFHRTLVRRAGHRDLEPIWTSLVSRTSAFLRDTYPRIYRQPLDIQKRRARMLAAFRSRDLEAALGLLGDRIDDRGRGKAAQKSTRAV